MGDKFLMCALSVIGLLNTAAAETWERLPGLEEDADLAFWYINRESLIAGGETGHIRRVWSKLVFQQRPYEIRTWHLVDCKTRLAKPINFDVYIDGVLESTDATPDAEWGDAPDGSPIGEIVNLACKDY